MIWADYLIIVISIFLVGLVMLQRSNDDIQGAFSGEKSDLFKQTKEFGFEKAISITTAVMAFVLVALVIYSNSIDRTFY